MSLYLLDTGERAIQNFMDFKEVAAPASPAADHARVYSRDDGGTTKLYYKRSNGTEVEIASASGTVTGSGTTDKLAKWTGSTTLGDSLLDDNGARIKLASSEGYLLQVGADSFGVRLFRAAAHNYQIRTNDDGAGGQQDAAKPSWAMTIHEDASDNIRFLRRSAGNPSFVELLKLTSTALAVTANVEARAGGALRFFDTDDSNFIGFVAPALAANTTYTWPAADGTNGQFLSTNGAGTLSWASGGGVTGSGTTNNLAKWTSASALGNSLMVDDGTLLKAERAGAMELLLKDTTNVVQCQIKAGTASVLIGATTTHDTLIQANATERVRVFSTAASEVIFKDNAGNSKHDFLNSYHYFVAQQSDAGTAAGYLWKSSDTADELKYRDGAGVVQLS